MTRLALLAALAVFALVGCSSQPKAEPIVDTVEVFVPVPVSCIPDETPAAPDTYSDTDEALLSAEGVDERYRLLIIGREERTLRLQEIEPLISTCRSVNRESANASD
jgi:hypothetical protein